MEFLQRLRQFCDLARRDIEAGTGVSASHLAEFENGRRLLNSFERAAVCSFLEAKLRTIGVEEQTPNDKELRPVNPGRRI